MHRRPNIRSNRRAVNVDDGRLLHEYLEPHDYWDAALGFTLDTGNVQSWAGQDLATTLVAPGATQRPAYNASDSEFGGRPSIDCFATDNRYLRIDTTGFYNTGSYFWCFVVYRDRSPATANHQIINVRHSGTGRNYVRVADNSGNEARILSFDSALNIAVPNADDSVHTLFAYFSAGGSLIQKDAGTPVTNAYNTAIAHDCDQMAFGGAVGSGNGGDMSFAWIGLGRESPPTPANIAAAHRYCQRTYGVI